MALQRRFRPMRMGDVQPIGSARVSTLPILPNSASVTRLDDGVFADPRFKFGAGSNPALPAMIPQAVIDATPPPPPPPTPVSVIVQQSVKAQIHTMMQNIILQPNTFTILLNGNVNRVGIQIQNSDASGSMRYAFGVQAGPTFGFVLPAQAIALYDFVTPNDVVWGYTTNATAMVITLADFSQSYS